MPESFILIPGRTSKQGTTLNEGKDSEGYLKEVSQITICSEDMERLDLKDGDKVRLSTEIGEIELSCRTAKKDELQTGVIFMPYGPYSSQLMGGDTQGTGMPDSKCIDVEMEKI